MTAKQWSRGLCWLCRKPDQPVTLIGPVTVLGVTAPGFACRGCCEWSRQYVNAWTRQYGARAAR